MRALFPLTKAEVSKCNFTIQLKKKSLIAANNKQKYIIFNIFNIYLI